MGFNLLDGVFGSIALFTNMRPILGEGSKNLNQRLDVADVRLWLRLCKGSSYFVQPGKAPKIAAMLHRHLNHQQFTLAAIDDVIARGRWQDWADMRRAVLSSPELMQKIVQVCRPNLHDAYAQRYHFWMNYAAEHRVDA
jgi:hypothetical protein